VDGQTRGGACRAAPAPLPAQTAECLGWVCGQAYDACSRSQQTLASSVWHDSVSRRRTFAVIKAVRWICSPLYCKQTQNARASTIQIRRRRQCLGKARRASRIRRGRLGRQCRMLLVETPAGPVRVLEWRLPRSRVHLNRPSMSQAPRRQDQNRAGAGRQEAPERRRNLSPRGP